MPHRMHGTGLFAEIYHKNQRSVGKYTIHGSYDILWDVAVCMGTGVL